VSLLWAINKEEKILDALREAIKETMSKDVEPLMCRRVRDGDKAASNYLQSGRMKSGWEIKGIDRSKIEKFSLRTQQVEAYAKEHGITEDAAKAKLGVKTREKKNKGTSVDLLRKPPSRSPMQTQVALKSTLKINLAFRRATKSVSAWAVLTSVVSNLKPMNKT